MARFPKDLKPKINKTDVVHSQQSLKRLRGIRLAESGAIEFIDVNKWRCRGTEKPYHFITKIGKDLFECDCSDYKFRGFESIIDDNVVDNNVLERRPELTEFNDCKHIFGVKHLIADGDNKLV
jgi:hypothetical protein